MDSKNDYDQSSATTAADSVLKMMINTKSQAPLEKYPIGVEFNHSTLFGPNEDVLDLAIHWTSLHPVDSVTDFEQQLQAIVAAATFEGPVWRIKKLEKLQRMWEPKVPKHHDATVDQGDRDYVVYRFTIMYLCWSDGDQASIDFGPMSDFDTISQLIRKSGVLEDLCLLVYFIRATKQTNQPFDQMLYLSVFTMILNKVQEDQKSEVQTLEQTSITNYAAVSDMSESQVKAILRYQMFNRHLHKVSSHGTSFDTKINEMASKQPSNNTDPRVLISMERYIYSQKKHSSYVLLPYKSIKVARLGKLDFTRGELQGKDVVCFELEWTDEEWLQPWNREEVYVTWEELCWDFASYVTLMKWLQNEGLDFKFQAEFQIGHKPQQATKVEPEQTEEQTAELEAAFAAAQQLRHKAIKQKRLKVLPKDLWRNIQSVKDGSVYFEEGIAEKDNDEGIVEQDNDEEFSGLQAALKRSSGEDTSSQSEDLQKTVQTVADALPPQRRPSSILREIPEKPKPQRIVNGEVQIKYWARTILDCDESEWQRAGQANSRVALLKSFKKVKEGFGNGITISSHKIRLYGKELKKHTKTTRAMSKLESEFEYTSLYQNSHRRETPLVKMFRSSVKTKDAVVTSLDLNSCLPIAINNSIGQQLYYTLFSFFKRQYQGRKSDFYSEALSFVTNNGFKLYNKCTYAPFIEQNEVRYLNLQTQKHLHRNAIYWMAHSCKLANLILAVSTEKSQFLIRIDKSPLHNEPFVSSHMIAGRFNYVHELFELQDSEGYWFLISEGKHPDWQMYLWNIFKGALNVVIYEWEHAKTKTLAKVVKKQIAKLSVKNEWTDMLHLWFPVEDECKRVLKCMEKLPSHKQASKAQAAQDFNDDVLKERKVLASQITGSCSLETAYYLRKDAKKLTEVGRDQIRLTQKEARQVALFDRGAASECEFAQEDGIDSLRDQTNKRRKTEQFSQQSSEEEERPGFRFIDATVVKSWFVENNPTSNSQQPINKAEELSLSENQNPDLTYGEFQGTQDTKKELPDISN